MKPDRLPNITLFGHVHGARRRGRPHKRWINNLDEDLKEMNLNIAEACRLAAYDRHDWRKSVIRLSERGQPSPRHSVKSSHSSSLISIEYCLVATMSSCISRSNAQGRCGGRVTFHPRPMECLVVALSHAISQYPAAAAAAATTFQLMTLVTQESDVG